MDTVENNNIDVSINNKCTKDGVRWESAVDNKGFSHRVPGQHFWRGHMYSGNLPLDTLETLINFDIHDDDCIVSGYPKSGEKLFCYRASYVIKHT